MTARSRCVASVQALLLQDLDRWTLLKQLARRRSPRHRDPEATLRCRAERTEVGDTCNSTALAGSMPVLGPMPSDVQWSSWREWFKDPDSSCSHRRAGGGSWTEDGGLHQIRLGRIWALPVARCTHRHPLSAPFNRELVPRPQSAVVGSVASDGRPMREINLW